MNPGSALSQLLTLASVALGALLGFLSISLADRRTRKHQIRTERRTSYARWFALDRVTRRKLDRLFRHSNDVLLDLSEYPSFLEAADDTLADLAELLQCTFNIHFLERDKDLRGMLVGLTGDLERLYSEVLEQFAPQREMARGLKRIETVSERIDKLRPDNPERPRLAESLQDVRANVEAIRDSHRDRMKQRNEAALRLLAEFGELSSQLLQVLASGVSEDSA
jgi:hypothetical protein